MRPTRDELLMGMAQLVAERSTCSRASVGAVVAYNGRPLVTGYNGAPSGMEHCAHSCDCPGPGGDWSSYNPSEAPSDGGHGYWCRSIQPCYVSVHAEANAIAFAAQYGVRLEGAEMHTTLCPCLSCAQLIINSGIVRVIALQEYRDTKGLDLLRNAGIALR